MTQIQKNSGLLALAFLLIASLFMVQPAEAASTGDDVKCAGQPAVYYLAEDGKRYAYPNERAWRSYYDGFDHVRVISCDDLQGITFGGLVPYQAGVRLIKVPSVPTVYAVSSDGVLRPIASEQQAIALYGEEWSDLVDDLPESFFPRYTVGVELSENELPEGMLLAGEDGSVLRVNADGVAVEVDTVVNAEQRAFLAQHTRRVEELESKLNRAISEIRSLTEQLAEYEELIDALKRIRVSEGDEVQIDVTEVEDEPHQSQDDNHNEDSTDDHSDDSHADDHSDEDEDRDDESDDESDDDTRRLPDVAVPDVYLDDDGILTARIVNEGDVDITSDQFFIYFWINGVPTWTYRVSTLADQSFLRAGRAAIVAPDRLTSDAEVGVCVDVHEQIEEENERNNCWNGRIEGHDEADPDHNDDSTERSDDDADADPDPDREEGDRETEADQRSDDGSFDIRVTAVDAIDALGNPDSTVRSFGFESSAPMDYFIIRIVNPDGTLHDEFNQTASSSSSTAWYVSPSWLTPMTAGLTYTYFITAEEQGASTLTDTESGSFTI